MDSGAHDRHRAPLMAHHARAWRRRVLVSSLTGLAAVLLASAAGVFYLAKRSTPVTIPSEYVQLTDFTDGAVAPSLSPDGRMVTFIRGGESFLSTGQIYVKLLPNGEAVRLTSGASPKTHRVHAGWIANRVHRDRSQLGLGVMGHMDSAGAWG